jgi:4-carboxymuconolactone decarboxylase
MATQIRVPDSVFDVRNHFNDREILEMTVTIGQYIATAKLLTTLDIGEQNDHDWDG